MWKNESLIDAWHEEVTYRAAKVLERLNQVSAVLNPRVYTKSRSLPDDVREMAQNIKNKIINKSSMIAAYVKSFENLQNATVSDNDEENNKRIAIGESFLRYGVNKPKNVLQLEQTANKLDAIIENLKQMYDFTPTQETVENLKNNFGVCHESYATCRPKRSSGPSSSSSGADSSRQTRYTQGAGSSWSSAQSSTSRAGNAGTPGQGAYTQRSSWNFAQASKNMFYKNYLESYVILVMETNNLVERTKKNAIQYAQEVEKYHNGTVDQIPELLKTVIKEHNEIIKLSKEATASVSEMEKIIEFQKKIQTRFDNLQEWNENIESSMQGSVFMAKGYVVRYRNVVLERDFQIKEYSKKYFFNLMFWWNSTIHTIGIETNLSNFNNDVGSMNQKITETRTTYKDVFENAASEDARAQMEEWSVKLDHVNKIFDESMTMTKTKRKHQAPETNEIHILGSLLREREIMKQNIILFNDNFASFTNYLVKEQETILKLQQNTQEKRKQKLLYDSSTSKLEVQNLRSQLEQSYAGIVDDTIKDAIARCTSIIDSLETLSTQINNANEKITLDQLQIRLEHLIKKSQDLESERRAELNEKMDEVREALRKAQIENVILPLLQKVEDLQRRHDKLYGESRSADDSAVSNRIVALIDDLESARTSNERLEQANKRLIDLRARFERIEELHRRMEFLTRHKRNIQGLAKLVFDAVGAFHPREVVPLLATGARHPNPTMDTWMHDRIVTRWNRLNSILERFKALNSIDEHDVNRLNNDAQYTADLKMIETWYAEDVMRSLARDLHWDIVVLRSELYKNDDVGKRVAASYEMVRRMLNGQGNNGDDDQPAPDPAIRTANGRCSSTTTTTTTIASSNAFKQNTTALSTTTTTTCAVVFIESNTATDLRKSERKTAYGVHRSVLKHGTAASAVVSIEFRSGRRRTERFCAQCDGSNDGNRR